MSKIERSAIKKMKILDETPLIVRLPRVVICPDPNQPRKKRNQEKLKGLAQTMQVKQLQPILVRQVDVDEVKRLKPVLVRQVESDISHMIVFGEGRWLAAGINEEESGEEQYLDCILVDEHNAGKIRAMQLIENLQREDMNELEVANGYRELIELGECANSKAVAGRMGVSEATVSVFLKVLHASQEIKDLVEKGITKIDTARTLMMLAEINKERADALVKDALETGVLKRSSVRNAYAEEKARAENPGAVAGAVQGAAGQPGQDVAGADVQQQDPVVTPAPAAADVQAASTAGGPGAGSNVAATAPSAPTETALEAQQNDADAVSQASEGVDKGAEKKAPQNAPKAAPQPAAENAKPTTADSPAAADVPAPAPAPQPVRDDAPLQAPADGALVVADQFDVLVSIRSGTPDEERFIELDVEYGNPRLASHSVHREPNWAWVQFGTGEEHQQLHAFQCSDLEIVKVVARA